MSGVVPGLVLFATACTGPDITVGDRGNLAPVVTVLSPDDGASFTELEAIDFVGTVADSNGLSDIASVVWTSDVDGELGVVVADDAGIVRLATTLSPGTHAVALTATDFDGVSGEVSIALNVGSAPSAPLAEILNPDDDDTFLVDVPITFVGGAVDPNQAPETLVVTWTAEPTAGGPVLQLFFGNPGLGGSTSVTWIDAPVGEHRIVLMVTDDGGNSAEDAVIVSVLDPNATDDDGDGWSENALDCDDTDPSISPGVAELCNGIDDDCSGLVDDKDLDADVHVDEDCVLYIGAWPIDDCDDDVSTTHPGAAELPNDVDDDCDGVVDEETDRWDDDGDCACEGVGPCAGSVVVCVDIVPLDCDDSTDLLSPQDVDGDGASTCAADCDDDNAFAHPFDFDLDGLSPCEGDCDDTAPEVGVGASEVTADGVDQNCDGVDVCFRDTDLDGYGSIVTLDGDDLDCGNTPGESPSSDDCNDVDGSRYPGAEEVVGDGVDQDCDDAEICFVDLDGDRWGSDDETPPGDLDCTDPGEASANGDCDDTDEDRFPGAVEVVGDGFDQDCDNVDDCYVDLDHDGVGGAVVSGGVVDLLCEEVLGLSDHTGDCADADASRSPEALEVVGDGVDQDCDNLDACYQDLDLDGFGTPIVVDAVDLDCLDAGRSDVSNDCDDTDGAVSPGASEVVADGSDQDCDGVDQCWFDNDSDGWGSGATVHGVDLSCEGFRESRVTGDCDDLDPDLNLDDGDGDGWSTCTGDCDDDDVLASPEDGDGDGLSGCDGDCDDSDATVSPSAADLPDAAFQDDNCDGIDGDVVSSLFVAPFGVDVGDCTFALPCGTLNYAADRADAIGLVDLLVMSGTYVGVLDLDGQEAWLWGGYDLNWSRADRATPGHLVVLAGGTSVDFQSMVIRARNAVLGVADVQLDSPDAVALALVSGKASYGIHAADSTVTVTRSEIVQGNGFSGVAGGAGAAAAGAPAASGGGGTAADQFFDTCDTSTVSGGGGGTNAACAGTDAGGGGASGAMDTSCGLFGLCSNCSATAGSAGSNASTFLGGVYGDGGNGGGTCTAGVDGLDGRVTNGSSGAKGAVGGVLSGDYWLGKTGSAGGTGEHGGGGGGGGGSGGCDNGLDTDTRGAGGGGGAAGGCRGTAGSGGGAGGGSFGVFALRSDVDVRSVAFLRGSGGSGGGGGSGGDGQPGGTGGSGGAADSGTGPGGRGGDGGHGGHGGGGGGGSGGSSFGLYSSDSSVVQVSNTFTGGAGGLGGVGGASDGNDGTSGDGGALGGVGTCASPAGC